MRFIIEPKNDIWVAVRDDLARNKSNNEIRKDIKLKFNSLQVWFSDLDDNDTDSPLPKKIAKMAIGTKHTNPRYLAWCVGTAFALILKGKKAESSRWEKYVKAFLQNDKRLAKIKKLFTSEEVKKSLYLGVEEFYSLLPTEKFYLTRNIKEIAQIYAEFLEFNGFFAETKNKGKIVEEFILNHPKVSRYGSGGDSLEDEGVCDILEFYAKKGEIDSFITLYCAKAPTEKEMNPKFQIQTGKNKNGLVDILNEEILSGTHYVSTKKEFSLNP